MDERGTAGTPPPAIKWENCIPQSSTMFSCWSPMYVGILVFVLFLPHKCQICEQFQSAFPLSLSLLCFGNRHHKLFCLLSILSRAATPQPSPPRDYFAEKFAPTQSPSPSPPLPLSLLLWFSAGFCIKHIPLARRKKATISSFNALLIDLYRACKIWMMKHHWPHFCQSPKMARKSTFAANMLLSLQ